MNNTNLVDHLRVPPSTLWLAVLLALAIIGIFLFDIGKKKALKHRWLLTTGGVTISGVGLVAMMLVAFQLPANGWLIDLKSGRVVAVLHENSPYAFWKPKGTIFIPREEYQALTEAFGRISLDQLVTQTTADRQALDAVWSGTVRLSPEGDSIGRLYQTFYNGGAGSQSPVQKARMTVKTLVDATARSQQLSGSSPGQIELARQQLKMDLHNSGFIAENLRVNVQRI